MNGHIYFHGHFHLFSIHDTKKRIQEKIKDKIKNKINIYIGVLSRQ